MNIITKTLILGTSTLLVLNFVLTGRALEAERKKEMELYSCRIQHTEPVYRYREVPVPLIISGAPRGLQEGSATVGKTPTRRGPQKIELPPCDPNDPLCGLEL